MLWNFRLNEENNLCRWWAEKTAYVIARLASLASEQYRGSCWLWPQLEIKTLFSFSFQTMLLVWLNYRKPKLFKRCIKLHPVGFVNSQERSSSQCNPCSFNFLGGDKGTEEITEIMVRFRAPESLCYHSQVPQQGKCWCRKVLLQRIIEEWNC